MTTQKQPLFLSLLVFCPYFVFFLAILLTTWHYFIIYLFAVCLPDHEFLKASVGSLVLIALSQVLGH